MATDQTALWLELVDQLEAMQDNDERPSFMLGSDGDGWAGMVSWGSEENRIVVSGAGETIDEVVGRLRDEVEAAVSA